MTVYEPFEFVNRDRDAANEEAIHALTAENGELKDENRILHARIVALTNQVESLTAERDDNAYYRNLYKAVSSSHADAANTIDQLTAERDLARDLAVRAGAFDGDGDEL